jgi:hypothetical protein
LGSAAAAAVLSLLWVMLVMPRPSSPQYVWFALTSTLGAWCLLASGQWWRGRTGEPALRRLWMLCVGLAVGAASWLLAGWLRVPVPMVWRPLAFSEELLKQGTPLFDNLANQPTWAAYLLYFGLSLALVRWWKQLHPQRPSHVSLWFAGATALAAWLVSLVIPYPQPVGMLLVANMSLAAQITAPRRASPQAGGPDPEGST